MADNPTSAPPIILNEAQQAFLAKLRAAGWMVVAPDCVGFPRSAREAEAMNVISESYLKSQRAKEISDAAE